MSTASNIIKKALFGLNPSTLNTLKDYAKPVGIGAGIGAAGMAGADLLGDHENETPEEKHKSLLKSMLVGGALGGVGGAGYNSINKLVEKNPGAPNKNDWSVIDALKAPTLMPTLPAAGMAGFGSRAGFKAYDKLKGINQPSFEAAGIKDPSKFNNFDIRSGANLTEFAADKAKTLNPDPKSVDYAKSYNDTIDKHRQMMADVTADAGRLKNVNPRVVYDYLRDIARKGNPMEGDGVTPMTDEKFAHMLKQILPKEHHASIERLFPRQGAPQTLLGMNVPTQARPGFKGILDNALIAASKKAPGLVKQPTRLPEAPMLMGRGRAATSAGLGVGTLVGLPILRSMLMHSDGVKLLEENPELANQLLQEALANQK